MSKILFVLVVLSILVPLSATAQIPITDEIDNANIVLTLEEDSVSIVPTVNWFLLIVTVICLLSVVISPIISFRHGKHARALLIEHHAPVAAGFALKLERDLIILNIRGAHLFKTLAIPLYIIFGVIVFFSLSFPLVLVITAVICLPCFLIGKRIKKKMFAPLTTFDTAHPELKNPNNLYGLTTIQIEPAYAEIHKKLTYREKVFRSLWYASFVGLIGSLLAYAIINFTVCCAANVTT